jgi:hypothetical protein
MGAVGSARCCPSASDRPSLRVGDRAAWTIPGLPSGVIYTIVVVLEVRKYKRHFLFTKCDFVAWGRLAPSTDELHLESRPQRRVRRDPRHRVAAALVRRARHGPRHRVAVRGRVGRHEVLPARLGRTLPLSAQERSGLAALTAVFLVLGAARSHDHISAGQ